MNLVTSFKEMKGEMYTRSSHSKECGLSCISDIEQLGFIYQRKRCSLNGYTKSIMDGYRLVYYLPFDISIILSCGWKASKLKTWSDMVKVLVIDESNCHREDLLIPVIATICDRNWLKLVKNWLSQADLCPFSNRWQWPANNHRWPPKAPLPDLRCQGDASPLPLGAHDRERSARRLCSRWANDGNHVFNPFIAIAMTMIKA